MIKVIKIDHPNDHHLDCTGGHYSWGSFELSDGTNVPAQFCGCWNGCSNTHRIPEVGFEFENMDAIIASMYDETEEETEIRIVVQENQARARKINPRWPLPPL